MHAREFSSVRYDRLGLSSLDSVFCSAREFSLFEALSASWHLLQVLSKKHFCAQQVIYVCVCLWKQQAANTNTKIPMPPSPPGHMIFVLSVC